jgi:serine phosphatase RsbU (regulator of sigma subunit)/pSer/pThr/pTyr-binding forkhead associated (FHA) protein
MAYLEILKGPSPGQKIQLDGRARLLVGRHAECDVVVNDPAVSREHALVLGIQGKYYVEDLRSRNKTYVNNQPVTARRLLVNGDRLKICDFIAVFHEAVEPRLADSDEESSSTIELAISRGSQPMFETQSTSKLAFLLDITSKMAQNFQPDSLLPLVMDSLFEWFRQADRGFIILRDDDTGQLRVAMVKTRSPHPGSNPRYSRRIVNHCLETGDAVLSKDASVDPQFGPSESISSSRIRSVMCVPLIARDTNQAFGVIQLDTQDHPKRFTGEDLKLLGAVASQAAVAFDNARLHRETRLREQTEHDMAMARQVQLSILPEELPVVPGYEFFAHYASALEVGGDYYDFVPLLDGRLGIVIGDVAGKGMPAALLMAKLASDARTCLQAAPDLASAVGRLNNLAHRATHQTDRFVTLVAAILEPAPGALTLVNAGHLSPLICRSSTASLEEAMPSDQAGLPVGIQRDAAYCPCRVNLEPGDTLLLFTDGVTEAADKGNIPFRSARVHETLRGGACTPQTLGERLVAAVKQYSLGCPQQDDITVVCVGRKAE